MGSAKSGRKRTVVAIDGPAGAGKSTVAGIVAERLGLAHIDTGATYRVVARVAVERGIPLTESAKVAEVAEEVSEHLSVDERGRLQFDGQQVGDEIRTADVSSAASVIAAYPDVRRVLVRIQRGLVPPRGAVVEGRDIGTVVWPNADLKVYLDASEEVRAARRDADPGGSGGVEAVRERDARDANRPVGAMRPAPDALVFDTTDRAAEVVAQLVLEHLRPPEPPGAFYTVVRGLLAGLLRGPFRLEVRGAENIPSRGAAIIAPNHRSLIDIPVAGVITKRKVWFMAKEELFASKQAAAFFRKMGAFPVRRGKPDRHALQRSLELLSEGELVGLFPEGTRRPMSRFEEVEEGLAYVALKSGAPVVPVAISGTEAVFPKDRKLPRFVKIRVLIGEPLRLGGPVTGMLPRSRVREATAIAAQRLQSVMDEIEPAGESRPS